MSLIDDRMEQFGFANDRRFFRELYEEKKFTVAQIAKMLNIDDSAVRTRMKRLGYTFKMGGARPHKTSLVDVKCEICQKPNRISNHTAAKLIDGKYHCYEHKRNSDGIYRPSTREIECYSCGKKRIVRNFEYEKLAKPYNCRKCYSKTLSQKSFRSAQMKKKWRGANGNAAR